MATTTTSNLASSAQRQVGDMTDDLRSELERYDRELRAAVKERPVVALLSAIALSMGLGRLFRRR